MLAQTGQAQALNSMRAARLVSRQLIRAARQCAARPPAAAACGSQPPSTSPAFSSTALRASQLLVARGQVQQGRRLSTAAAASPAAAAAAAAAAEAAEAEASTSYGASQIQVRARNARAAVQQRPGPAGLPVSRRSTCMHACIPHAASPAPSTRRSPRPAGAARPGAGAQAAGHVHRVHGAAGPAPPGLRDPGQLDRRGAGGARHGCALCCPCCVRSPAVWRHGRRAWSHAGARRGAGKLVEVGGAGRAGGSPSVLVRCAERTAVCWWHGLIPQPVVQSSPPSGAEVYVELDCTTGWVTIVDNGR